MMMTAFAATETVHVAAITRIRYYWYARVRIFSFYEI